MKNYLKPKSKSISFDSETILSASTKHGELHVNSECGTYNPKDATSFDDLNEAPQIPRYGNVPQ